MKLKHLMYFALLISFVLYAYWQATGDNDLLKAFRNGDLRLILTAKDGGKSVDLTIEKVSNTVLTVIIKKGKTPIEIYGHGRAFLICDSEKRIFLYKSRARAASKTLNLPIEQEGGVTWTSGTVIWGPVINLRGK